MADQVAEVRLGGSRPAAAWLGLFALSALILVVGGPLVVAVPVVSVIACYRPTWLAGIAFAAMIAAGALAAHGTAGRYGAFGASAQACALLALAAALTPVLPGSLDTSPPLRFLLAHGPQHDCVILNTHHALLDGRSCLALLHAVSRHYSGQPAEAAAPARTPAVTTAVTSAWRVSQPTVLSRGSLPGRVARIARRPAAGAREHRSGHGVEALTWDRLPSVRGSLNVLGGSVNDLLITAMMMAVSRWNESNAIRSGRIRITMPIGDRAAQSADLGWGSSSRLTSVTAPVTPGLGAGQLIAAVVPQTSYAKDRQGPQVDLPARCLAAAPVPAAVQRQLLRVMLRLVGPVTCDTSLVSNLGVIDPPSFGSGTASQALFSTSAHMPRGLSLGAVTIGSRLYLCFRYRRALLSDSAAAEFAAGYVDVLDQFAGQGLPC